MSTTLAITKPAVAGKSAARPSRVEILDHPVPPHPDGELLALGAELEIAWASESPSGETTCTDEAFEAAYQRAASIADKIVSLRATSLDGLRVKARAALWCQGDGTKPFILGGGVVDDMTISASIVNDILAMGGCA